MNPQAAAPLTFSGPASAQRVTNQTTPRLSPMHMGPCYDGRRTRIRVISVVRETATAWIAVYSATTYARCHPGYILGRGTCCWRMLSTSVASRSLIRRTRAATRLRLRSCGVSWCSTCGLGVSIIGRDSRIGSSSTGLRTSAERDSGGIGLHCCMTRQTDLFLPRSTPHRGTKAPTD